MTTIEVTGGTIVINQTAYNSINYIAKHSGDIVTICNDVVARDIICDGPYDALDLIGFGVLSSASAFVSVFNTLVAEQDNKEPTEIRSANGQAINAMPWKAAVVVPSGTTIFPRGVLYVGTGGDVFVKPAGQADFVLFKNIPDGSFLPVHIVAVSNHPSTTATDMLICW